MNSALAARFLKFAGVGAVATGIQYAVLVACVEVFAAPAVLASALGFVIGAVANYWLNYHFTFRSDKPHLAAASRFALTAAVGLAINSGIMLLLAHRLGMVYLFAQVIATALVLAWTFTVNSLWSFGATPPTLGKAAK